MSERISRGFVSWAFICAGLMTLACGASMPPPPQDEPDGGSGQPDGGSDGGLSYTCPVPSPATCPNPAPRYADVEPIFASRCTGCHAGEPGGPWSLKDYGHILDWQDTVRSHVRDCTMPPEEARIPMTFEERTALLTWIRCGLPR